MLIDMTDYSIGIKAFDDAFEAIKNSSNIMIIGPPMNGKGTIMNDIVYQGLKAGGSAVIVNTRDTGENVIDWFNYNHPDITLESLCIVDCVTKTMGVPTIDIANIKRVSSPADLTDIGIKISQFLEYFRIKKNTQKTTLCINSLSTILMYSNIQTVFRFLHVFTNRVKAAGARGIYVVEEGMHDEQSITTLKQLCDGMIEVKSENNVNLIRMVGIFPKPTPWFEYEIDKAKVMIGRVRN
jgi:KaiC/GvpD/RAD55 family RecA-like ATPase